MNNLARLSKRAVSMSWKILCLPDVLRVTVHKVRGGCWDCIDSQKNILTFLELQQLEQMVFFPTPHHSLSFPYSCPIVHFSHLSVSLVWIQHPVKSAENLPLTLFGFASCFLSSLHLCLNPNPCLTSRQFGSCLCIISLFTSCTLPRASAEQWWGKLWGIDTARVSSWKESLWKIFSLDYSGTTFSLAFSSLNQKENRNMFLS